MLRPAHKREAVLGPRIVVVVIVAATLGLRVQRLIARETMSCAGDRRRTAVCPLFSSSGFPPLDSSLVLLLWNFAVEPWFGEHFGFGRIWRRSLRVLHLI
jgi:hypothetical protein